LTIQSRAEELARFRVGVIEELSAAHEAREAGLAACRQVIRSCSRSIRMVHRREFAAASDMASHAEQSLRRAQDVLGPFPKVAHAGFLHDAEKEYAEARLTAAFVAGEALQGPAEIGVGTAAWLNGLAEAASELRRYLLDLLRSGDMSRGDELLEDMDDVYELLVGIDFPDALTGGVRRTTDAFRAVLERTRSDYTTAVMQAQLQASIEVLRTAIESRSS
jgi:translin